MPALQIRSVLKPGTDLHISAISTLTRQLLCQLLDPVDPLGKDWCLLAVKLGLVDKLPKLETSVINSHKLSQTARLLDEWEHHPTSKIGKCLGFICHLYFLTFILNVQVV